MPSNSSIDRRQSDSVVISHSNVNSPVSSVTNKKDVAKPLKSPSKLIISVNKAINPRQYEIGQDVEFEKVANGESIPGNKN